MPITFDDLNTSIKKFINPEKCQHYIEAVRNLEEVVTFTDIGSLLKMGFSLVEAITFNWERLSIDEAALFQIQTRNVILIQKLLKNTVRCPSYLIEIMVRYLHETRQTIELKGEITDFPQDSKSMLRPIGDLFNFHPLQNKALFSYESVERVLNAAHFALMSPFINEAFQMLHESRKILPTLQISRQYEPLRQKQLAFIDTALTTYRTDCSINNMDDPFKGQISYIDKETAKGNILHITKRSVQKWLESKDSLLTSYYRHKKEDTVKREIYDTNLSLEYRL